MVKVGLPKLGPKFFSSWLFVLTAGVVLALIAILDSGGLGQAPAATTPVSGGSSACQLQVSADQLNLRAGPSQDARLVGTLTRGTVVEGTGIVTNYYRQLADGNWAVTEFLTPVSGSNCN